MINGAEAHRSTALCQPYAYVHIGYVCVYYCSIYYKAVRVGGGGTMEDMCYERLRSEACVDCVCFITAGPGLVCPSRTHRLCIRTYRYFAYVCVFYYCRTYYKAVRVGGGGEWRTCAMRDDEPRLVWSSLPITH